MATFRPDFMNPAGISSFPAGLFLSGRMFTDRPGNLMLPAGQYSSGRELHHFRPGSPSFPAGQDKSGRDVQHFRPGKPISARNFILSGRTRQSRPRMPRFPAGQGCSGRDRQDFRPDKPVPAGIRFPAVKISGKACKEIGSGLESTELSD